MDSTVLADSSALDGSIRDSSTSDSATDDASQRDSNISTDSSVTDGNMDAGPREASIPTDASTPIVGSFQQLGSTIDFDVEFPSGHLAIDSTGAPILTYEVSSNGGFAIRVSRFENGAWNNVGGLVSQTPSSPFARVPRVTRTSDGLLLSFIEENRYPTYRWDGSTWFQLGNALGAGDSLVPFVSIIALGDQPWIAYNETPNFLSTPMSVFVQGWNGNTWSQRGSAFAPGSNGSALVPELATNGDKVFVLYSQSSMMLAEWNSNSEQWTAHGPIVPPGGASMTNVSAGRIAVDSSGRAMVAYHVYDNTVGHTLGYLARFENNQWTTAGGPFNEVPANGHTSMGALTVSNDTAFVAFYENRTEGPSFYVRACKEGLCSLAGGGAVWEPNTESYGFPQMATAPDGTVYLLLTARESGVTRGRFYRFQP